jgi:thiaminase/transcriptional activator TenA
VESYAAPGFQRLATTLEDLLDRLGGEPALVADHYRTAMKLELAFFDAAQAQSP